MAKLTEPELPRIPAPLAPLVAAKKSVAEGEVKPSVVVPLLVVWLPYWSSSWKLSATLVVPLAVAVDGLGVTAACAAAPALTVKDADVPVTPAWAAVRVVLWASVKTIPDAVPTPEVKFTVTG